MLPKSLRIDMATLVKALGFPPNKAEYSQVAEKDLSFHNRTTYRPEKSQVSYYASSAESLSGILRQSFPHSEGPFAFLGPAIRSFRRSEERRVGKECRSRRWWYAY